MKLSELNNGEKFKIISVNASGEIAKRLVEMGFTKNTEGTIIRSALLSDPIQIRLMDYDISVRKSEAQMVEVEYASDEGVNFSNSESIYSKNETPLYSEASAENVYGKVQAKKKITIGLAGNPNTGKTSIFNSLTGSHQKTGNYAGVTVEKKEGLVKYKGYQFHIYDLPGTYSLSAYSMDEMVARDFILNDKPDIIIDVLDSTNLKRNLYLLLQFQEMDIPVIAVLNMNDQAQSMGIDIDETYLAQITGITFVKTVGSKGENVDSIFDSVIAYHETEGKFYSQFSTSYTSGLPSSYISKKVHYSKEIEAEMENIEKLLDANEIGFSKRWLAIKLLEKDKSAHEKIKMFTNAKEIEDAVKKGVLFLEGHYNLDSEIIIAEERYGYINGIIAEVVKIKTANKESMTEKIDKILLNKYLGLPIFLLILYLIFQATFKLGEYPMTALEYGFAYLSDIVRKVIPPGFLQSVIVDGIISGIGGVTSFVPLIIILFMFISFLEDLGYMSRAAFIVDKFLHSFGLHGQSFFPMMIGFGCSVPAIMACRTLKNMKDRIITIMIIPFMSCGAKLPVYILLAGAFFPKHAGNMVMLMYVIGVVFSLIAAKVMSRVLSKGVDSPFVMELPLYRMPTLKAILWHTKSKTLSYVKRAATVLLVVSLFVWAATVFPKMSEAKQKEVREGIVSSVIKINENLSAEQNANNLSEEDVMAVSSIMRQKEIEYSFAGRIGKLIEPLVRPIGFDWRVGISVITGLAAKEVVVSTLAILYGASEDDNDGLVGALQKDKNFTALTAFILMIFTLVMTPCISTLVMVKNELGLKWLMFFITYTTIFAWLLGFIIYQCASFYMNII